MNDWRFLFSRRWVAGLVLILVFAVLCHVLAQWQLARRAQAQAEIQRVERNYDATPVDVNAALPTRESYSADQKWTPVVLNGQYLASEEVLVRNRPCAGASGYEVLTPFQLDDGDVFIVDRGCVPAGSVTNTAATYQPAPGGEQRIVVRLRAGEPVVQGREDTGSTLGSIALERIAERVGLPAYTGAYGQLDSAETINPPFRFQRPDPDEGPHLSYALQWYVFAAIAFVAYGWAARNERRNRRDDAAQAVDTPQGVVSAATSDAELSARYGQSGAGGRWRNASKSRVRRSDSSIEDDALDAAESEAQHPALNESSEQL